MDESIKAGSNWSTEGAVYSDLLLYNDLALWPMLNCFS